MSIYNIFIKKIKYLFYKIGSRSRATLLIFVLLITLVLLKPIILNMYSKIVANDVLTEIVENDILYISMYRNTFLSRTDSLRILRTISDRKTINTFSNLLLKSTGVSLTHPSAYCVTIYSIHMKNKRRFFCEITNTSNMGTVIYLYDSEKYRIAILKNNKMENWCIDLPE